MAAGRSRSPGMVGLGYMTRVPAGNFTESKSSPNHMRRGAALASRWTTQPSCGTTAWRPTAFGAGSPNSNGRASRAERFSVGVAIVAPFNRALLEVQNRPAALDRHPLQTPVRIHRYRMSDGF